MIYNNKQMKNSEFEASFWRIYQNLIFWNNEISYDSVIATWIYYDILYNHALISVITSVKIVFLKIWCSKY